MEDPDKLLATLVGRAREGRAEVVTRPGSRGHGSGVATFSEAHASSEAHALSDVYAEPGGTRGRELVEDTTARTGTRAGACA